MQTITLKGYGTNIPPYEAIELGTYDSYGVEQLQIVPSHGWENLSIIASFFPPSAGSPIQVAFFKKTITSFTVTGAQPMPALAGVNTVLTDADSATVTGRADPIKRITDLEDAVASQT